ncbi:MAG: LD-carboxypeptidase [Deltaproteobacteria bacterium]|nr:MAG: LD-carboxypeptidase [Deltaproteobacteria bacterium]
MLFPPPLTPGCAVRVVAPSSPFDVRLVRRGLDWLAERYQVRFDRSIFSAEGYLAGSDEQRFRQLEAALIEPELRAVLCARGGYGASRYAHKLDWSQLRRTPRWLVGFSDVTALHVEVAKLGVASLHGCNVTALGSGDARTRSALVATLESPQSARVFDELETLVPGTAAGPLFGGNLAMLHACAAAGRLQLPERCVLFIEEIGERPYRLDRMLTTLIVGGHLAPAAAVVVGELVACEPKTKGVEVNELLAQRLGELGVPVACGLPVGHGLRNEPVVLGAPARLSAHPRDAKLELGHH